MRNKFLLLSITNIFLVIFMIFVSSNTYRSQNIASLVRELDDTLVIEIKNDKIVLDNREVDLINLEALLIDKQFDNISINIGENVLADILLDVVAVAKKAGAVNIIIGDQDV